jgi:hypothetical protein
LEIHIHDKTFARDFSCLRGRWHLESGREKEVQSTLETLDLLRIVPATAIYLSTNETTIWAVEAALVEETDG